MATSSGREFFSPRYFNIGLIPAHTWAILDCGEPMDRHRSFLIRRADVCAQKSFVHELLGRSVITATTYIRGDKIETFCSPRLEAILARSGDTRDFIQTVDGLAQRAKDTISNEERKRLRYPRDLKSAILDVFLFWLCQRKLLLRPVRSWVFGNNTRGFDVAILQKEVAEMWRACRATYYGTRKRSAMWERDLYAACLIIISSTTLRNGIDISEPLFKNLFRLLDAQVSTPTRPDFLAIVFRSLRDCVNETVSVPAVKTFRNKAAAACLFGWTEMEYSAEVKSCFPDLFNRPYSPQPNILAWVKAIRTAWPKIQTKTCGGMRGTVNSFLTWLIISQNKSSNVAELKREDINDGKESENSSCFRASLVRRRITATAVNANISQLHKLFDYIIEDLPRPVANPVVLRFDRAKRPSSCGKTPRRALGRDMLDYLRDFNAKDNFALSRSRPAHTRRLFDRASGQYKEVWFPAVARILDLLLRLPLRGMQARFLDFGEGDEFIPDLVSADLQMIWTSSHSQLRAAGRARSR